MVLFGKLCRITERLEAATSGQDGVADADSIWLNQPTASMGFVDARVCGGQLRFLTWIISQKLRLTLIRVALEHDLGHRNRRIHL